MGERFPLKEAAKKRIADFYLTLISIIQSLALGYLFEYLQYEKVFGDRFSGTYLLQVIATLQVIILVWFEYAMSVVVFRWVINIIDSLIPFLFGVSQYVLIAFMNHESDTEGLWFLGFSILAAVALFAFKNQETKSRRESENAEVMQLMDARHHWRITYAFVIATVIFVFFAFISVHHALLFAGWRILCLLLVNFTLMAFAVFRSIVWKQVYSIRILVEEEPERLPDPGSVG